MAIVYVHLSDIHFGQERGGQLVVNNDVKDQLIIDVRNVILSLPTKKANGIIISGDIAFAGKKEEYDKAGLWLDQLTNAVGCTRTSVQVVPGNHDIDLDRVSPGTQTIINEIVQRGDKALDTYLEKEQDRELLYHRFSEYRTFAEAYNCPLDGDGTIIGHRTVEIAPKRYIKFHGVNTALICSRSKEENGALLLGKRQRVIPSEPATEVIVVAHHPLHWLLDSDDALRYIKNRARVFISGHEHMPSHNLESIDEHADLLSIASGATIPPNATEEYTYCYNVLEFDWEKQTDSLQVKVHPRIWNDERKSFHKDTKHFHEDKCTFTLKCPSFRNIPIEQEEANWTQGPEPEEQDLKIAKTTKVEAKGNNTMSDTTNQILLLKFFRELSGSQRLAILVKMGVLPEELPSPITHNLETMALKSIFSNGKTDELKSLINEQINSKKENKKND